MSANLEVLFSSTARVQILRLFLLNRAKFYQREIERQTGQPIRAVQREVERLVRTLDTQTPQVLIESRIVPASQMPSPVWTVARPGSTDVTTQRELPVSGPAMRMKACSSPWSPNWPRLRRTHEDSTGCFRPTVSLTWTRRVG